MVFTDHPVICPDIEMKTRNRAGLSGVSSYVSAGAETTRKAVVLSLLVCVIFVAGWLVSTSVRAPFADRTISSIALSRTGKWLAAGTAKGEITVWELWSAGARHQISFRHGSLNDLQFSPDEETLAIASSDLGMCPTEDCSDPRLLRSDRKNYGTVRFSGDSQTVLVVTGTGTIETIDAHSGASRLRICCSSIYGEVSFTPDGQAIASAGHWPGLWDARSGQEVARLTANREFYTFRPIAFDSGRDTILMGSQDGRVYVWSLEGRRLIARSPAQTAYVDALTVSKDGWVIFAGFGEELEVWNPQTGQRHSIRGARPTSNLIPSPDGSVIFGTARGEIAFWDIATAQRIRTLKIPGA